MFCRAEQLLCETNHKMFPITNSLRFNYSDNSHYLYLEGHSTDLWTRVHTTFPDWFMNTLPWTLPGCLSWSPWECRCLAEHQPKPELLHQWQSWIPSSNSATCCWPAACHRRPEIRHEEAMEDVHFYSYWFKSHSVSPQPLDHYSALLPCWTFSHVCSSPWLLQCPLEWELECSGGGSSG